MRPGRLVLVTAVLAAWIAGSALGTVTPVRRAGASPLLQLGKVRADFTPDFAGRKPIFILFLGSDARVPDGERIEGQRSDAIHLVGINPAKRQASILGFPRDAMVDIPGFAPNKINSAMVSGGPQLTVRTVEALTGIKIHYYALTSFGGMQRMINDVGGLVVHVPFEMRDDLSHSNFAPGVKRLNGAEVLAFTRDRHSLLSGDFGRSENQGRVFLCALQQFQKEFRKDPSRMLRWLGAGLRNMETDVPLSELIPLGFLASKIDPARVRNIVIPGSIGNQGTQSVVFLSSQATGIYTDMRKDGLVQPKLVPPGPEAERSPIGSTCDLGGK